VFCTMYSVDISVAHGGRQDITMPPSSSLIIYADLPNFTVVRLASLVVAGGGGSTAMHYVRDRGRV